MQEHLPREIPQPRDPTPRWPRRVLADAPQTATNTSDSFRGYLPCARALRDPLLSAEGPANQPQQVSDSLVQRCPRAVAPAEFLPADQTNYVPSPSDVTGNPQS